MLTLSTRKSCVPAEPAPFVRIFNCAEISRPDHVGVTVVEIVCKFVEELPALIEPDVQLAAVEVPAVVVTISESSNVDADERGMTAADNCVCSPLRMIPVTS